MSRSLGIQRAIRCSMLGIALLGFTARESWAAEVQEKTKPSARREALELSVIKAIDFLKGSQADDGSYSAAAGPGITALITTAILRHGRGPEDPQVAKGLACLERFVNPNGSICKQGSRFQSYETFLSIVCFAEANKGGKYEKVLANADKFIREAQFDASEGHDEASLYFGGAGYGGDSRPDLSNTNFLLDALAAAGADENDEAVKHALVFVSRCQNLESEHNTTEFPAKNPDGGFYYTPAGGGSSAAGKLDNGGLRSYASMTYAGLKSMIFAGVDRDDPRVKAAVDWLSRNYSLKENPGMGTNGLFYYYHTFAKALDALGEAEFKDSSGQSHAWREELIDELLARQRSDGSWVNDNAQWMEGDKNMVTGFALLSLSYCLEKKGGASGSSKEKPAR